MSESSKPAFPQPHPRTKRHATWDQKLASLAKTLTERDAELAALRAEVERLRGALHRVSLGAQNSMTSKEDLGATARKVLEPIT